jgi:hypothetical protein
MTGHRDATAKELRDALRARMHDDEPNLGLATTGELIDEVRARIQVDYAAGGGGLDYTTVDGRPDEQETR